MIVWYDMLVVVLTVTLYNKIKLYYVVKCVLAHCYMLGACVVRHVYDCHCYILYCSLYILQQ